MKFDFTDYTHSIPIIFSHIEGQYPLVLSEEKNEFQILFTSFDYHYATGKIPNKEEPLLNVMRNYIKKHKKEEFILYGPNDEWDDYLTKLFSYIGGVIDIRYAFKLDEAQFMRHYNTVELKHEVIIEKIHNEESLKPYYRAVVFEAGEVVSYCRAFMVGKQQAELDVWTESHHRYQGLAYETSLMLIKKLLDEGITPNWTTWEQKKASHILAYKLGFEFERKIKAFIWVDEMGEF